MKKVVSRYYLLRRIIFEIRNGFWVNGELNHFGVGQSISPILATVEKGAQQEGVCYNTHNNTSGAAAHFVSRDGKKA